MRALLLCLPLLAAAAGCATFAAKSELRYGKAWQEFAAQAGSATVSGPAGPAAPAADLEADRYFDRAPQAQEAVRRVQRVLRSREATKKEVRGAMQELQRAEGLVGRLDRDDPVLAAELRARLEELRKQVEAKLLEVLVIEPSFNVAKRGAVRIAVVKIGEGVETIRRAEMLLWRSYLKEAGFSGDVVFISGPLAGAAPTAADLRVAAARLGADAVLAYTASAAVTTGTLRESVAVLAFTKCMLVDTRSEYLYLNAEGEGRVKWIGVPFTKNPKTVELETLRQSLGALRLEITRELARLVETEQAND